MLLRAAAIDGIWARRGIDLVDSKKLAPDIAPYTIRDYINPSLDTTISATGHLTRLLSQNPDQWDKVRAEPGLAPAAIAEAVRLGTPIRSFARTAVDDITVEGVVIPKGARVMMLYASSGMSNHLSLGRTTDLPFSGESGSGTTTSLLHISPA